MDVIRKSLFESEALLIGSVISRPLSDACGEVSWSSWNAVILPVSGVFSKHDAPGRHVIGTPSHAVFVAADKPFRVAFPGAIGDRVLTLRFGEALAPEEIDAPGGESLAPHGLLSARTMVLRNLLWTRFAKGEADPFEIETLGLDLLGMSLRSVRSGNLPPRRSALLRRMRALERVKEAIALTPADKWNVARLARVANLSPFHLCRVFRQMVGTSVYDYVLHERLAQALNAVLDAGSDLTAIALDAGFASHSHFTARFRRFYGCTPAALRSVATAEHVMQLRTIMTAQRSQLAVD